MRLKKIVQLTLAYGVLLLAGFTANQVASKSMTITVKPTLTGDCGPNRNAQCSIYCTGHAGCAVIEPPTPPFNMTTPQNTIRCDPSINTNGVCNSTSAVNPEVLATSPTSGLSYTMNPSGGANDVSWNSDDTMLMISITNGNRQAIGFASLAMQVTNGTIFSINMANFAFHRSINNIIYSLTTGSSTNGPKIWQTTFNTVNGIPNPNSVASQVQIFDPVASCSIITGKTVTGGSLTITNDSSTLIGALLTNGQNNVGFWFAWNQNTNKCSAVDTSTGNVLKYDGTVVAAVGTNLCWPIGLHNANAFGNGTNVHASTGAIGACTNRPLFWTIDSSSVFSCTGDPGEGHNAQGYNWWFGANNPQFIAGNLAAGQTAFCQGLATNIGQFPYVGVPGDVENHFGDGLPATDDTQPMVGGTGWFNWDGTFTNWQAGVSELFVITGLTNPANYKWYRIAHTFNSGNTLCPKCDFRTNNGIVAGSQTHRYIAYPTDGLLSFGVDSNGVPLQEIVIVRLDYPGSF